METGHIFLTKRKLIELYEIAEETFVVVPEENWEEAIDTFCAAIFAANSTEPVEDILAKYDLSLEMLPDDFTLSVDINEGRKTKKLLKQILSAFPRPYTIVQELYHIDRSYRDTYYLYFSNQHFHKKRYSTRLSFFCGEWNFDRFFSEKWNEKGCELEKYFMGCCVLNPLISGALGRTLIHPKYVLSLDKRPAYVRLSKFCVHILGKKLHIEAFPYRMQDEETMRCTEVTILNLLEYYSNSYQDYKNVVPHEIIESEQRHSHERVLPAQGMTYPILTKVFSEFGFSPRLYSVTAIDQFPYSHIRQEDELKRWLHYYIESGIPVALNLLPLGNTGTGHSIVCIGHGAQNKDLVKNAFRNRRVAWKDCKECHPIVNSADFYDEYVVVDDNEPVYQVRKFNQLSLYADMRVKNIAAPLYKRMFLDAPNASAIITSLLQYKGYRVEDWAKDYLDPQEPIIIRLFMASSHSFKKYRAAHLTFKEVKEVYALTPMPRFVWVCELYRVDDYNELKAFGEIVIDATSTPNRTFRSLIMMHYPQYIILRYPQQTEAEFDDIVHLKEDSTFLGFRNNLLKIAP